MNMSHAATKIRDGSNEQEGLDEGHVEHQDTEGDEAEDTHRGWEWTEDDWRPAGMLYPP